MSSDSIGLSADRDKSSDAAQPGVPADASGMLETGKNAAQSETATANEASSESANSTQSSAGDQYAYEGSEPIFSVFMQAQVNLQTTRLTIKERVVQNVSDLVAEMELARREFMHLGNATKAIQDCKRIGTTFEQRAQEWNRAAQAIERDTRNMSGNDAKRMRAEHSRIRTSLNVLNRYFTKLEVELNQIAANQLVEKKRGAALGSAVGSLGAGSSASQQGLLNEESANYDADGSGLGANASADLDMQSEPTDHDESVTSSDPQDVMTKLGEYDTADQDNDGEPAAGNWKSVVDEGEDQTPGQRIDLSIYNDLDIEHVEGYQSLCEIIGEGLPISYDRCSRKILGGGDAREHAWDYGSKMSIAARWVPVVDTPWLDAVFFLWLVPKKSDIARDLHYAMDKFRLCFSNDHLWQELRFQAVRPEGIAVPQNKKIRALMEKADELFRQSNDRGKNFFLTHVPLAHGIQSDFFLTIEKSQ